MKRRCVTKSTYTTYEARMLWVVCENIVSQIPKLEAVGVEIEFLDSWRQALENHPIEGRDDLGTQVHHKKCARLQALQGQ